MHHVRLAPSGIHETMDFAPARILRASEGEFVQTRGLLRVWSPLYRLTGNLRFPKTFLLRSGDVETVKVHHFVPYCNKVVEELLLGVLTSVDFRQGPELGVRTED